MKLVNRGFISIFPNKKFWTWANANCAEDNMVFENAEPSIYLIEEDFWEEDSIIEKYYKKIFKNEFETVNPNAEIWPEVNSIEDFHAYFKFNSGNMVFDLLKENITSTLD
jgi:hypothetical protein